MRRNIIVCLLMVILFLSSCGPAVYHNQKADDTISKAIYEELGDVVYYQGRREYSEGQPYYSYLIREESGDVLGSMVTVVNETIKKESITDEVIIHLCHERPGGWGTSARLYYFSSEELSSSDYDGLQKLMIIGNDNDNDSYIYNNPATYLILEDVRYLEIKEEIQERAESEGIDWYEYWPDLESIETF